MGATQEIRPSGAPAAAALGVSPQEPVLGGIPAGQPTADTIPLSLVEAIERGLAMEAKPWSAWMEGVTNSGRSWVFPPAHFMNGRACASGVRDRVAMTSAGDVNQKREMCYTPKLAPQGSQKR